MNNFTPNIKPLHASEWTKSCVDPDIINLNVISLSGANPFDFLCYGLDHSQRTNTGILRNYWLRRYQHIEYGGWWCAGIDLTTNKDSEWGCFKPDRPRIDKHKHKTIKYEHPANVSTELFALKISDRLWEKVAETNHLSMPANKKAGFWGWVKNTSRLPIIITEGAKKAGALLSAGYCAVALPGIDNGFTEVDGDRQLIEALQVLACSDREFVFCFDSDKKYTTKKNVAAAILRTGKALVSSKCRVSVCEWHPDKGKGIDDLLASEGNEYFETIFEKRIRLSEYEQIKKQKIKKLNIKELLEFIEGEFEDKLTFNELRGEILLDGKPLVLNPELRSWFVKTYDYSCSHEDFVANLCYLAKTRSFNPVKQYLAHCHQNAPKVSIDDLATRYFGTTSPLYNLMLRRWLIGAVARAIKPGCQMDYALVLQGKQGVLKSSFFRALGGEFFDDSIKDVSSDDAHLILDSCWIAELAEIDKITSKRAASEVKHFITQRTPRFRKKYDREASEHPRRAAICGSVNKTEFLMDETGERRYWVIPISEDLEEINIDQLETERDGIWATAVESFYSGELPMLEREWEALSFENNQQFQVGDEWETSISRFLKDREETTISEILTRVLDIELGRQDRPIQTRVGMILTRLGWKSKLKMHNGVREKTYTPGKLI